MDLCFASGRRLNDGDWGAYVALFLLRYWPLCPRMILPNDHFARGSAGCAGSVGGWMDGWMDGWIGGKGGTDGK